MTEDSSASSPAGEGQGHRPRIVTDLELYEISLVAEPANPHARIISVSKVEGTTDV